VAQRQALKLLHSLPLFHKEFIMGKLNGGKKSVKKVIKAVKKATKKNGE